MSKYEYLFFTSLLILQLFQEQELHSSIAKEKDVFIELWKKAQN